MDQKKLYLDLNRAFNQLFRRLSAVDAAEYNRSTLCDHWTSGQLGAHLVLSARGLLRLVNGPAELRDRPMDEKVPLIRDFMLDYSRKYSSPKDIQPGNGPFDFVSQTEELNELQLSWLEAARLLDPALTCLLFPLPAVGLVTRQEAGCFILYHFQRHLHQMEQE